MSSEADVQKIADHIQAKHGHLNVLVNCAGIASRGPVFDFSSNKPHSLEQFTKIIQVTEIVENAW